MFVMGMLHSLGLCTNTVYQCEGRPGRVVLEAQGMEMTLAVFVWGKDRLRIYMRQIPRFFFGI